MNLPVHFAEPEKFHGRDTVFVPYHGSESPNVHRLQDGEIILSKPLEEPLASSRYINCFGIAGRSPTGKNVLAHICPGTLGKGGDFSTVFLRSNAERIGDILSEWNEEGGFTDNSQLGIFGSCISAQNGTRGARSYLEAVGILNDLLGQHFSGNPQILSLPQIGSRYQHARISYNGLTIYQVPPRITLPKRTHFTLREVRKVVSLLIS